jgi:hypothetical protein
LILGAPPRGKTSMSHEVFLEVDAFCAAARLEHDGVGRKRPTAESYSRFKTLERVLIGKAIPLFRNALTVRGR